MKLISTGAERFLTSDAVADGVLDYAGVLARVNTAETITIPFVDERGAAAEARLLLGPTSQISLLPGDGPETALDETSAVTELRRRMAVLEPGPIPVDADPYVGFADPDEA
jgi:hypothetical protein